MKIKVKRNKDFILKGNKLHFRVPIDAHCLSIEDMDKLFEKEECVINVDFISWILCYLFSLRITLLTIWRKYVTI